MHFFYFLLVHKGQKMFQNVKFHHILIPPKYDYFRFFEWL